MFKIPDQYSAPVDGLAIDTSDNSDSPVGKFISTPTRSVAAFPGSPEGRGRQIPAITGNLTARNSLRIADIRLMFDESRSKWSIAQHVVTY
jgi:hypothetical protein